MEVDERAGACAGDGCGCDECGTGEAKDGGGFLGEDVVGEDIGKGERVGVVDVEGREVVGGFEVAAAGGFEGAYFVEKVVFQGFAVGGFIVVDVDDLGGFG